MEYAHSNLRPRVAAVLFKILPYAFFDCMWDNPVAAVRHPGKVEQAMFGPHFLGPSSTGGELCGMLAQSPWYLPKRDAMPFPSLSDHLTKAAYVLSMN